MAATESEVCHTAVDKAALQSSSDERFRNPSILLGTWHPHAQALLTQAIKQEAHFTPAVLLDTPQH